MTLEKPVLPLDQWLANNWASSLAVLLAIMGLALFAGFLLSALRHGPQMALRRTFASMGDAMRDLSDVSARRLFAMAWLAFQESIRSKVLIALAIFLVLLLFAGLFLDVESEAPQQVYISFVLQATSYLVVALAVFLSSFSLPNDLKQRTIYTVVTKPVRAWEIVLGRIIGFVTIGTILIALMLASSYIFVLSGLRHQHQVELASMRAVTAAAGGQTGQEGRTSLDSYHRHQLRLDAEGRGRTDTRMGHWHAVRQDGQGGETRFRLGAPRGMLEARIPIRGHLRFLDREGNPTERGLSVGKEFAYRGYIEGGTSAAAIWTFQGVTQRRFPRYLPLEMMIRVFRTHIGDIERGITGTVVLRNPTSGTQSMPRQFTAVEFTPQQMYIQRELEHRTADGRLVNIDLHDDLVHEGTLEVIIQCLEPDQYFGVAEADVYLRAADNWFWLNFVKGYLGVWFQMVLVVGFGVMFSTFLSGAVAMLATLFSMVTGFFAKFIVEVATGQQEGGGPVEAMIRIFKQMNLVTPLDENVSTTVVQGFDSVVMFVMRGIAYVLPDYGGFSTVHFVAYGFDVPAALLIQHFVITVVYFVVLTCAGYFLLKSREIAA